ncbi:MAG: 4-hydroxythreonine-4-phosphate dehydrogenase PdxA [Candidatus Aminicenantes bacterium]|nr:4-hydroxythreonine-4-phosphate dehydrogenase PdxA [Candidatus Aminicenantes bacterium]
MTLPRIGVTVGDPAGIGPEIIIKAFSRPERLPAAEYRIYAPRSVLETEEKALGIAPARGRAVFAEGREGRVSLVPGEEPRAPFSKGAPSAEGGRLSFLYFKEAVEDAGKDRLESVVTAPISKAAWSSAGVEWRGHTEYLDNLYPGAIMTFWSERLKVALFSHHLPLREALDLVREKHLYDFFIRLRKGFRSAGLADAEFLLAGLNPHAGEGGVLGGEELSEILPAVRRARREGMILSDPFPPDVVFRMALDRPKTVAVALHHDQGLIAFKLLAFETGVNATLGLPFVRTSPDHGTAFDIAGRNAADPASLVEALRLAVRLTAASL